MATKLFYVLAFGLLSSGTLSAQMSAPRPISAESTDPDAVSYSADHEQMMAKTNDEDKPASPVHSGLRKHLLAFSPMQFSESGVGFAFSYEHGIDKDGIVSYILPVAATFNLSEDASLNGNSDAMVYFTPGLKFYPTSSFGKVKYAIGPSLVLGAGQETNYYMSSPYPNYSQYYRADDKLLLGIMISNSLNLNPTPRFYLGLDFGLGFSYIYRLNNVNQGMTALVQGGFKLGYRF